MSDIITTTPTARRPIISFTQIDQYLRCPLKYRLAYVDRLDPEFVPAALIFGRGIHEAAAHYFRGVQAGAAPTLAEVQGVFETYWELETGLRPVKFWKGSKEESLAQAAGMLAAFHAAQDPAAASARSSPRSDRARRRPAARAWLRPASAACVSPALQARPAWRRCRPDYWRPAAESCVPMAAPGAAAPDGREPRRPAAAQAQPRVPVWAGRVQRALPPCRRRRRQ